MERNRTIPTSGNEMLEDVANNAQFDRSSFEAAFIAKSSLLLFPPYMYVIGFSETI